MKKLLIIITFLSSVMFVSSVFAFGGCETDCQKCHSLSKEEAKEVFSKLQAPDIEVVEIKMSPIGGLWEVSFENQGKRGMTYISFSKKYVMGGQIFEVDTASNKSQEKLQKMGGEARKYIDPSTVPLGDALLLGEKDARYKVVVFTDPD